MAPQPFKLVPIDEAEPVAASAAPAFSLVPLDDVEPTNAPAFSLTPLDEPEPSALDRTRSRMTSVLDTVSQPSTALGRAPYNREMSALIDAQQTGVEPPVSSGSLFLDTGKKLQAKAADRVMAGTRSPSDGLITRANKQLASDAKAVGGIVKRNFQQTGLGAQEQVSDKQYFDARLDFARATVLPTAVRDAIKQNISITDHPDIVAMAETLGVRPDQLATNWTHYVNKTPEELTTIRDDAISRVRELSPQKSDLSAKRKTIDADMAKLRPFEEDELSLRSILFDAATSMPDIGVSVAAGMLNPAAGVATLGAMVEPRFYAQAKSKGYEPSKALGFAGLMTAAEIIPETPVMEVLTGRLRLGSKLAEKVIGKTATNIASKGVAEGASEAVTSAAQTFIESEFDGTDIDLSKMTLGMLRDALTGGVVGVGIGAIQASAAPKTAAAARETAQQFDLSQFERELADIESETLSDTPPDDLTTSLDGQADVVPPPDATSAEPPGQGRPPITDVAIDDDTDPFAPPAQVQRLQTDETLRTHLERMALESGWETEGGKLIRASEDVDSAEYNTIVGRTKWLPRADWWPDRPKGFNEQQTKQVIAKAMAGETLSKPEQRLVDFMVQVADTFQRTGEYMPRADEMDNGSEATQDDAHEAALVARAADLFPEDFEWLAIQHEEDQNAFLTSIKGLLDGHDNQTTGGDGAQSSDAPQAGARPTEADTGLELDSETAQPQTRIAASRLPAGPDLFGDDVTTKQALADERRRRDQKRNAGQDSLETGDPTDLFSQSRRQADLTDAPVATVLGQRVSAPAEPTEAQKKSGRYQKPSVQWQGLTIKVENLKGSERSGADQSGKAWKRTMAGDYGYFSRTEAKDGDHVDVYMGNRPDAGTVYVIDQLTPDGAKYDEAKVVVGVESEAAARKLYADHYPKGWSGLGAITAMPAADFKAWVTSDRTKQPVAWQTSKAVEKEEAPADAEGPFFSRAEPPPAFRPDAKEAENFRRELRKAVSSLRTNVYPVSLGRTSPVLRAVGAKDLPIEVSRDVVRKAVNGVKHVVPMTAIERLPEELHDPLLVFKSATQDNAIVVLTEERDSNGDPMVVAVDMRATGTTYRVNRISTIHGREGESVFTGWVNKGLLLYKSKRASERGPSLPGLKGVYFPNRLPGTAQVLTEADIESTVADRDAPKSENQTAKVRTKLTALAEDPEPHRKGIEQAVRKALQGVKGAPNVHVLHNALKLPDEVKARYADQFQNLSLREARGIEGQYDPQTGNVYIFSDVVKTPARASWVLFHELAGHHGIREAARKLGTPIDHILDRAYANSTVSALAKVIAEQRELFSWKRATDEALAELAAAVRTKNYAHLKQRYQIDVTPDKRGTLRAMIERTLLRIKAWLAKLFDVKPGAFTDAEVYDLLQTGWGAIQRGTKSSKSAKRQAPLDSKRENAPTFYSALTRAAQNAKINKGDGAQWLNTLRNTPGVKAEEIEATDLEQFLGDRKGITKQEVVEYLSSNGVQVTETVHGGKSSSLAQQEHDRLVVELTALGYTPDSPDDTGNIAMDGPDDTRWIFEPEQEVWVNPEDENQALPDTVLDLANRLAEIRMPMDELAMVATSDDGTRYGKYTLPGGKNYRELLLTLPDRKQADDLDSFDLLTEMERARFRAATSNASLFRSAHWNEPNVLAHIRFDERTDVDGKKVMHIAEVQSDWHQAGRKRGYNTGRLTDADVRDFHDLSAEVWNSSTERERSELRRDAVLAGEHGGVPDAPFKTTWPELSMKRAIRYAAENGFDRITWDTGATNAERYDLSKQISKVEYLPKSMGVGANEPGVIRAWDLNGKSVMDRNATPTELPDIIGKDVAEKLLNSSPAYTSGSGKPVHRLEGLDLKVGGEGMIGFYDRILPATVGKLIKKWGGKVESTYLGRDQHNKALANDSIAHAAAIGAAPVHGFLITDAMRDSSLDGMPLFSRSTQTQEAYEHRIDELFAGGKPNRIGAKVLDRSDVLGLLGYPDKPVVLAEGKVIAGQTNHPRMTADVWKKIPEWLENPAAAFDSDTVPGSLVVIAPELVGGAPVRIILVPDAQVENLQLHLLSNAYDAQGKTPWRRWFSDGLARYIDKQKFPGIVAPSGLQLSGVEQPSRGIVFPGREAVAGRQLPGTALQNKPGTGRILTEKNLAGYRRAQEAQDGPLFSEADDPNGVHAARHGMAGTAYVPMYQGGQIVPLQATSVTIGTGPGARQLPIPTKPIRREHILAQMQRDFDVKVYQGKPFKGRRMLGFFRPSNFEVRIKNKNDLEVTAHEIFHWLDDTYPDLKRLYHQKRFDSELRSISYDAKKLHEGFAEFGRLYMTQDAQALQRVPQFYAAFTQTIKQLGIEERLIKIQDRMHQWYLQGALMRAQSKIGREPEPIAQRMSALADVYSDRAMTESFDYLHPAKVIERTLTGAIAKDAMNSPYKGLRLLAGGRNTIESFLNFGTLNWTPKGLEFTGKGLKQIFEPVAHVMDDAMSYFVGRRAQELMKYGKERLFTPDEIEAMLNAGLQSPARKEIEQAFNDYQGYVNRLMDFAQDSGIVSAETRAIWSSMYQNYVPFYRVPETMGSTSLGGGAPGANNPFKRLFGGTANLRDIWDNIVMNTAVVVQASLRNKAKQQLFRAIEKSPLGQRYAVRIPTDTQSVKVGMTQVEAVLRGLVDEAQTRAADPNASPADRMHYAQVMQAIDLLTGAKNTAGGAALDAMQDQATFYVGGQPPSIPDRDSMMVNGERVWFQIADPLLWDMLSDINYHKPIGLLEKVFGAFKRTLTRGVTITPEFQIANLIRDTLNAFTMSKGGQIPFYHQVRAMGDILRQSEDYKLFIANGGGFGNATPEHEGRKVRLRMTKLLGHNSKVSIRAILDTPAKLLDFWDRWGQSFELATRLAEFKRLKGKGASLREAAYEGREISSDFAMHGRAGVIRAAMISLPFTNARLQGLYRLERELFEKGGRQSWRGDRMVQYAMRGFIGITMPALLLYFLNKDDEDYQALDDTTKYNYYPIKIPGTHDFVLIPKPFETGALFSTIPEQAWAYQASRNSRKLGDAAAFMLINTFALNPIPQVGRPILEWNANKNWTGSPIIPFNLENVEASEQYKWNTPESLVKVGKAFDVSPIALNHFLNGYLGGISSYLVMASDSLVTSKQYGDDPAKRFSEYQVARRFLREYPYNTTSQAREFWDLKREVDRVVNTARKIRQEGRGDDIEKYLGDSEKAVMFGLGGTPATLGIKGGVAHKPTVPTVAARASDVAAEQIKIRRDKEMTGADKRKEIDALQEELNGYFKQVADELSIEDLERYRDALEGKAPQASVSEKLNDLRSLVDGKPRRQQVAALRSNGLPATAALFASLPPTPDREAMSVFSTMTSEPT